MMQPRAGSGDPLVSVCIANYNGAGVLEDCLDSVLAQDCGFPIEILVHDDASTDGSVDIVRARHPDVIVMASEKNVGFCVSNNRMAAAARGKYLLLLNNDAALFPDALRTLYAYAESQPVAGLLGLPQYDMATGELVDIGSLSDPFLNPVPNLDANRRKVAMVSGACLWIPRALWEELGGFPEWFHTLAEDLYLACAARLRGYPVEALPHSGFKHHFGKNLGGGKVIGNRLATTMKRRALSERNKSFVMVLAYPAPLFQCLFPLHLVLLLAEGAVLAAVKGRLAVFSEIYLAALKSLWQEKRRLRLLRRELQSQRRGGRWQFFSVFDWVPHKLRLLLRHGIPGIR